jgi:hypothetical protein
MFMLNRFSIISFSALVLLLAGCSRPLKPQDACNFVRNDQQQRVSWKGHLPIKIALHTSVPTEAYDAIDRAVLEYKNTLGHGTQDIFQIVQRGVGGELNPQQDGVSMIYWFNTWDPARPFEQARTTIYWSGNQITEADMRINGSTDFQFNYGTTTSFSDLDLDSLVLHELGHVLGLAHNPANGSIMNVTLDNGQDRRDIGAIDEASLSCEY